MVVFIWVYVSYNTYRFQYIVNRLLLSQSKYLSRQTGVSILPLARSLPHHSANPLPTNPSHSRHLVTQLLRDFYGEARLCDFLERDIPIGETAFGFDRSDNIADAFPGGNAGVVKRSLHDAVSIRRSLLVHLQHSRDEIESPFSRLEHGALAELQGSDDTLDFIGPCFDRAIHRRQNARRHLDHRADVKQAHETAPLGKEHGGRIERGRVDKAGVERLHEIAARHRNRDIVLNGQTAFLQS